MGNIAQLQSAPSWLTKKLTAKRGQPHNFSNTHFAMGWGFDLSQTPHEATMWICFAARDEFFISTLACIEWEWKGGKFTKVCPSSSITRCLSVSCKVYLLLFFTAFFIPVAS